MGTASNRAAYNALNAYLGSGTFYAVATTTAATDAAARDYNTLADVTGALTECSGTGYSRLAVTWTVTEDDANDRAEAVFATITYPSANFDAPGTLGEVWIFKQAGGAPAGTDELVVACTSADFPVATSGLSVAVVADSEGVLRAVTA